MQYQNMLCLGDSQTFGARSYGCYPMYLAEVLTSGTPYTWRAINRSVNGYTARDLWFKVNEEIDTIADTYQACLLIGTNDAGLGTDPELFAAYYRQIVDTLLIKGYKAVLCGEVPPIYPDGHVFFLRDAAERRTILNTYLGKIVEESSRTHLVGLDSLTRDHYVDPVHFNERGNKHLAGLFAEAVVAL